MQQTGALAISGTRQQLMPTSERQARVLSKQDKATEFRRIPLSMTIKSRESDEVSPLQVQLDSGIKKWGVVPVNKAIRRVVFAMEIAHRGMFINMKLKSRHELRQIEDEKDDFDGKIQRAFNPMLGGVQ